MHPDVETRLEVDAQIKKFKNDEGKFGLEMAILTREKKQPGKPYCYLLILLNFNY